MLKWLFHILILATDSGKYQNQEKPLKRQRKLGLVDSMANSVECAGFPIECSTRDKVYVHARVESLLHQYFKCS